MSPLRGTPCFSKEWGFSYPHSHGGTKSPPSYPPNSGPPGPSESNRGEEGDRNVPPPGAPCLSKKGVGARGHEPGGTEF